MKCMKSCTMSTGSCIKACLDGMILSAWQNHTWFCHVWFLCLDGITMSCVISFNNEETGWVPWAISSCSTSFHCYSQEHEFKLIPASQDFCQLLSHLLMFLGSLYGEQYRPRSDCSLEAVWSWVILFISMIRSPLKCTWIYAADTIFRTKYWHV